MDRLRGDSEGRYWVRENGAEEEFCDKDEVKVQEATQVKIPSSMSHNS
jgi:hypothetical protein